MGKTTCTRCGTDSEGPDCYVCKPATQSGVGWMTKEQMTPIPPAPAPLNPFAGAAYFDITDPYTHIAALTSRLAEVEAMQAHDAECAATAIRARIEAEARVVELTNSAALNDEMLRHALAEEQFARQQAEARVVELEREVREMDSACSTLLSSVCAERDQAEAQRDAALAVADRRGKKIQRTAENLCATRKKLSKVEGEREAHRATVARIVEWARGRCGTCEYEGSEDDTCYNCQSDYEQSNWTLPQALEVGE